MDFSSYFPRPKKAYFDSAASSLTALPVLDKMQEYYRNYRANIHRGEHSITKKASEEYEAVYGKLAKFFNASDQEFTAVRNTTEGINGVSLGLDWKAGDEVVVSDVEHHSNLLPWLRLKRKGVSIKVLQAEKGGELNPDALAQLVSRKTKLVAFTACSNVLGCKVPIQEMATVAKDAGALVLLDAAQYVGHHPLDLKKVPVDFMAFSGHKSFAPTGIGVLFHRSKAGLEPWFVGGGTIKDASLESFEFMPNRDRFEAGTPAIAQWIGLGAALDFISKVGYGAIEQKDKELELSLKQVFDGIPEATVFGPSAAEEKACALYAFNIKGVSHHQAAIMLDQMGFALRAGHHCAIPLTKKLGVEGTARASLHVYNSVEEVKSFGEALKKVAVLSG